MKINKSQLKVIVKECLVEILNEGLAGSLAAPRTTQTTQGRQTMADSRRSGLSLPERRVVPNNTVQQSIVKTAAAGNPILESIFADTMQTTYRDMVESERPGAMMPLSGVERVVSESTPEQLFGDEAASKWLAIMDRVGND